MSLICIVFERISTDDVKLGIFRNTLKKAKKMKLMRNSERQANGRTLKKNKVCSHMKKWRRGAKLQTRQHRGAGTVAPQRNPDMLLSLVLNEYKEQSRFFLRP